MYSNNKILATCFYDWVSGILLYDRYNAINSFLTNSKDIFTYRFHPNVYIPILWLIAVELSYIPSPMETTQK